MLKKTILMTAGSVVFIVGAITFPMPVPIGLPLMIIGLTIMMKTSFKVKRIFLRLTHRSQQTRSVWQKGRSLAKRKKR